MPTKLPKGERQRSSSIKGTAPATKQENQPGAMADEISAEQMEEVFMRAFQTVKPIIKREAENEIVGEEILGFKLG